MTAIRRNVRTPLALTVLNLLDERAMHPYEMQQLIRERGLDQSVKLKGGSIYDTMERLVAAGLVEALETSREGRRPERTVYAITDAGRDRFRAWLQEMLSRPAQEYPQLGAARPCGAEAEEPAPAARMFRGGEFAGHGVHEGKGSVAEQARRWVRCGSGRSRWPLPSTRTTDDLGGSGQDTRPTATGRRPRGWHHESRSPTRGSAVAGGRRSSGQTMTSRSR